MNLRSWTRALDPMPPTESSRNARAGQRLPVAIAIVAVLLLLVALPERVRAAPNWVILLVGLLVLVPMAGVTLTAADPRWVRAERRMTVLVCILMGSSSVANLVFLVRAMLSESPASSGLVLLSSGTAVWFTNILVFSLLYWQLDRGGPEGRLGDSAARADWQFPQAQPPNDTPPGWQPLFLDYLALGFTTATAFSPADVLPLSRRAKALMMLESFISLVTIVVVGARAINILGR